MNLESAECREAGGTSICGRESDGTDGEAAGVGEGALAGPSEAGDDEEFNTVD